MNEDLRKTLNIIEMDPKHTIHHYDLFGVDSSSATLHSSQEVSQSSDLLAQPDDYLADLDEETDLFLKEIIHIQGGSENIDDQALGNIELKDILGKGGMGVVFLGKQLLPNRDVAVKRLISQTPILSRALLEEAMTMGYIAVRLTISAPAAEVAHWPMDPLELEQRCKAYGCFD